MTCGTYKLEFAGTNKSYIGQSINIEHRFYEHLKSFKNKDASTKMQEAYSLYGKPTLSIIIECSTHELDTCENEAISIWNAVDNGFNTNYCANGGANLRGEDNPRSLYTNAQILQVLNLLITNDGLSLVDISELTNVSVNTVWSVSSGTTHKWLKDIDENLYLKLISSKKERIYKSKNYPIVLSPIGIEYKIEHLSNFAKEHKLHLGSLHAVLHKNRLSHKGWKLA